MKEKLNRISLDKKEDRKKENLNTESKEEGPGSFNTLGSAADTDMRMFMKQMEFNEFEEKKTNLDSQELEKKIDKIMSKKMEEEIKDFVGKLMTEKDEKDEAIRKERQRDIYEVRGKRLSLRALKTRANKIIREYEMERYREEYQARFWEIDKKTEEAKRKLMNSTSRNNTHLSSHGKIGNNSGTNNSRARLTSLPPLSSNIRKEKSPSPCPSLGDSLKEIDEKEKITIFDESEVPDMTRLDSVLRAKLKPHMNSKEEDDELNMKMSQRKDRQGLNHMYKAYVGKSLGENSFMNRVSHSPYLSGQTRSRQNSAKKRLEHRLTTHQDSTIDNEISLLKNHSLMEPHYGNTSQDEQYESIRHNKSSIIERPDVKGNAYHINYSYQKPRAGRNVSNHRVSKTPTKTFNNKNVIGGPSNLIKGGTQASQTNTKVQQKRSASVIAEVSEHMRSANSYGNMSLNQNTPVRMTPRTAEKRLNSRGGGEVTAGSLLRQVYRIKTVQREESKYNILSLNFFNFLSNSPDELKTNESIYGNRKYIDKLLKERRSSQEVMSTLERKGASFPRAERSFYLKDEL